MLQKIIAVFGLPILIFFLSYQFAVLTQSFVVLGASLFLITFISIALFRRFNLVGLDRITRISLPFAWAMLVVIFTLWTDTAGLSLSQVAGLSFLAGANGVAFFVFGALFSKFSG